MCLYYSIVHVILYHIILSAAKVPKSQMQMVPKEVPKYVLQAQERIVDVPTVLTHERPVEAPVESRKG